MLYILTLTWNKLDSLTRLKNSIIPALTGLDYQWIIKDNNSNDNTFETVSTTWDNSKINIFKYKDNLQNFSEGMNYIYNIANPLNNDNILLLNNDIIIDNKSSIKKMISLLKGDVGVVGTKLLYTNTNKLQHAGVVFVNHGLPMNYRDGNEDDNVASKNREFQAVTGAVMLMKSDTYKNICKTNKSGISGLDEKCRWMYDDIDACLAVSKNQEKKIFYCGETKIFHDSSASLKINKVNVLFQNHNINYFLSKWKGRYDLDFVKYSSNTAYGLIK